MSRKPNLFVIGAMRSGTTSVCQHLGSHPDIFMSPDKEPMHFSRKENLSNGQTRYSQLFSGAANQKYVAEGSTEYAKHPFFGDVAQRLYSFNSSARIIYIMRDPFDRLISQYKHMVRREGETRNLTEVLGGYSDYLMISYYAHQIRPYLELFGHEAVFLYTLESIKASPESFCKHIFDWLGIDSTYVPPTINEHFHVSATDHVDLDGDSQVVKILRSLKKISLVDRALPHSIRELGKKIVPKKIIDFTSEKFEAEKAVLRKALQPIFSKWILELENITGLTYDIWQSRKKSTMPANIAELKKNFWLPDEIKAELK